MLKQHTNIYKNKILNAQQDWTKQKAQRTTARMWFNLFIHLFFKKKNSSTSNSMVRDLFGKPKTVGNRSLCLTRGFEFESNLHTCNIVRSLEGELCHLLWCYLSRKSFVIYCGVTCLEKLVYETQMNYLYTLWNKWKFNHRYRKKGKK